ncbi:MAG: M23 family peptidase, partial [Lachnospiraceae bacterium]
MLVLILILMLAAFQVTLFDYLVNNPDYYQLDKMVWETDEFRQMALGDLIVQEPVLDAETIAALMVEKDYDLTDLTELDPKGEA